jgi:hypothetical protein
MTGGGLAVTGGLKFFLLGVKTGKNFDPPFKLID